jgi:alpha-beta hydrolase superfamily lysophospholipase
MQSISEIEKKWQRDMLGPEYQMLELIHPDDYEGAVKSVLIRHRANADTPKAVLYVHGFIDYFFQKELAEFFASSGFRFFALDLRKYGRSMMPHQKPNYCRSIDEYFEDIDAALELIRAYGHSEIVLMGHSTGGLTMPLYLNRHPSPDIKGLILNSPFLDFNVPALLRASIPLVLWIGARFPEAKTDILPQHYPKSLHKDWKGEWDFNTEWKPIKNFPQYFAWMRAIRLAHLELQSGLNIEVPVLVTHSDKSYKKMRWSEQVRRSDAVLDVEHIKKYAPVLGNKVTVAEVPGAVHDMVLSGKEVRDEVYAVMRKWMLSQEIAE